jgi:hypothetical protein
MADKSCVLIKVDVSKSHHAVHYACAHMVPHSLKPEQEWPDGWSFGAAGDYRDVLLCKPCGSYSEEEYTVAAPQPMTSYHQTPRQFVKQKERDLAKGQGR